MRLERWIAFDGAAVAEVIEAAEAHADAESDAADDGEPGDLYLLETVDADAAHPNYASIIGQLDDGTMFTVLYPDASDAERPFWQYFPVSLNPNSVAPDAVPGEDLYFELTAPDQGAFSLWGAGDKDGFSAKFFSDPSLDYSGWYAFDNGDNTFSTAYWNGSGWSAADASGATGGSGQIAYSDTGAVRFHVTDGNTGYGDQQTVNSVFRSIVHTPDQPLAAGDPHSGYSGYNINVYHMDNAGNGTDGSQYFHGKSGGAYHEGNPDVTEHHRDSRRPDDDPTLDENHPQYRPRHDPRVQQGVWDNEPLTIVEHPPPVILPPNRGFDHGDIGGGEGGEGEGDAGGDSGDGNGGDMVYIVQREGMAGDDADDGDQPEAAMETAAIELEETDDDDPDASTAALTADLLREAEALLESVRGDRDALMQSLGALQIEYLRHDLRIEGPLRDFLRELFVLGDGEKAATARVIDEMRRQLATLAAFAPEHRDGMLMESLRELVESAERRSGEMGALSQGLDAVTTLLAGWTERGQTPDAAEARAAFDTVHAAARAEWAARAERLDPMGRELTAAVH